MPKATRKDNLRALFEVVALKSEQLRQAVRFGDDRLVRLLDRELDPLIVAVVEYHASNSDEIYQQLRFISDLIRDNADDRSCVTRHSSVLSTLLDRYFGDGEERPATGKSEQVRVAAIAGDDNLFNESILNTLSEQVAVVTTDYRYLYANPAHALTLKRRQIEIVGRHVAEFMPGSHFEDFTRTRLDRCFAGETLTFTFSYRPWGREGAACCTMTPFEGNDGRIVGAVVLIRPKQEPCSKIAA
ncbi:PAS domain-containing protein [Ciceribacter lividus]|uniref:PAS domain-containing protein n=1 Tax=Ciceribacter lividus TaxID=1197950 RepID=A0A6I7HSD7_9HYPH|nr:PAS domain-containing protein [Ciceribacter lividus]RCW28654.1 PAS domain-containing protein [Ciceribacter lividus]